MPKCGADILAHTGTLLMMMMMWKINIKIQLCILFYYIIIVHGMSMVIAEKGRARRRNEATQQNDAHRCWSGGPKKNQ